MRWVVRGVGVLLLLMLLAAAALHWVIVPRIDELRPRLQQLATQAIGAPVHIGLIEAHSNGLVPSVALRDVRVLDPEGRAALQVPRVLAAFSVLSLSTLAGCWPAASTCRATPPAIPGRPTGSSRRTR